jgi:hypothetical protein
MALPSVWASVEATCAGTGAGATGASVLGVLGALADLVGVAATGAGAGAGAVVVAEAVEEVFFAILLLVYTLLCEVFLSIFRQYILYSFICLKKCLLLSSKK